MRENIAAFTDLLYQEILVEYEGEPLPSDETIAEYANESDTKLAVIQQVDGVVRKIGLQSPEQDAAYAIAVDAAIDIAKSYRQLTREEIKGRDELLDKQEQQLQQAQIQVSTINLQNKRLKTATIKYLKALEEQRDPTIISQLKAELDALLGRGQLSGADL